MDSQSHLLCWVCDELHPSTPFPLPLLWWSSSRLYLLQYLALWILHACLPTGVLLNWHREMAFWKVSLMVSPICFHRWKKFVWALQNVGWRRKKSRGLSWEGRRLPVWLSPPLSAWAVCAGCSPACAIWLTWNENRIVSLMFHQPACVCNCLSICLSKYKSILTPTYVWNQDRMIKRKEFIYLPLFILLFSAGRPEVRVNAGVLTANACTNIY